MKNILIIILLLAASCVQKSYDQEVKFVLDVSALKDIKTVGIRGEASPLSWEKDLPMEVLKKDSLYTITLTGKTGYRFTEVKFVVNGDFELQEKPNRKIIFDSSRKTVYQAKFNVQ